MQGKVELVRHWFERAVSVPLQNRLAFLETNCADVAVRTEVLSLLEHDGEDSDQGPEAALSSVNVQEAIEAAFGQGCGPHAPVQRVGPFELGRLLGSGGMGFVYEAHRTDGQVRQRVAVKFVQVPHSASEELRKSAHRRFMRERQMLASLRHPYIAGLIDAGATADGTPYAVIEQVDGVPVDVFCDEHGLDQNLRIRLVLRLCEAVQCAHRNLIVHSDIKPDNVLVTSDGMPKLIDFGIASDLSEEATLSKFRAFTPGYASPEQSIGMDPTVATDVFGIGAVLYRLLAGTKPRDVKDGPIAGMIRQISEEDVIRPSVIKPELKGDLENILLKALQREPQRRYGSVPELAEDLNCFLASRPVRATPDSTFYIARRFVRRNSASLAAAATLAAVLVVTTLVAIKQRADALQRAQETRRLADRLLIEVHDEIGGLVGGTKARERLGAIAVQYLESLERSQTPDQELAWELLNAYSRLGQSRGGGASSVGDTKSALNSAAKTLELGAFLEAAGPDAGRLEGLFSAYAKVVPVFEAANRPVQRREAIEGMLRLATRLQPLREAQAHKELARYYDSLARPQESADSFARSLRILRELPGGASGPSGTASELESTLVSYGRSQALSGDFSGAVASLREAIQLAERTTASEPHVARNARHLYWSHVAIGDVHGSPFRFNLGLTREALEHYRKARSIAERLLLADPGNDVAKLDLARAFAREGAALMASQPAPAIELMQRAHRLTLETSDQNQPGLVYRFEYLTSLIEPLVRLRKLDEAHALMAEAKAALPRIQQNGALANDRSLLKARALLLHASGQPREALAESQRHLALLPAKTNPLISENFEVVQVLERIRAFAEGVDEAACVSATERLASIWRDLRAANPRSAFAHNRAERARSLDPKACAAKEAASRGL